MVPDDAETGRSAGRRLERLAETVTEAALGKFGGALRAVLVYDVDADPVLDVHYIRDDVSAQYDTPVREVAAEIGHDDVFASIDREWEGRNPLGSFRASVRLFDRGAVVRVVPEPGRGVSVSLEHEVFPGLESFLDAVDSSFEERRGPDEYHR